MLIPGGARGIGRAVALALAGEGWRVAVAYRASQAAADDTVALAREARADALALRADVSVPEEAQALVAAVAERWGGVDALVNSFGPFQRVPLADETPDNWRATFDHNLHPVFYLTQAVAPVMAARGWGRIVNFALVNADRVTAHPNLTAYAIAKMGVLVLTRTYAGLLSGKGITVNAISPGYIDTGLAPEEAQRLAAAIPAGRVGAPADAVAAVRFLLSEEAAYISGANIQVSGGWGL